MASMTAPAADDALIDFAVDAARRAGDLALGWYQRADLCLEHKPDGSPVTTADREVEELLRELIHSRFPDDALLGEEGSDRPGTTDRLWVIDPIDGTKAFIRGVPLFANLVALVDGHGPAVGVVNLPALDECVWAGRGHGAFWNGEACRVSRHHQIADSYLCTSGFSYWPEPALDRVLATGAHVRTWGDAYGYVLVATGRAEAMIDPECFDWDVAPMAILLTEAGGRFSDRAGATSWRNGSAVASNGLVHDDILALLDPTERTTEPGL